MNNQFKCNVKYVLYPLKQNTSANSGKAKKWKKTVKNQLDQYSTVPCPEEMNQHLSRRRQCQFNLVVSLCVSRAVRSVFHSPVRCQLECIMTGHVTGHMTVMWTRQSGQARSGRRVGRWPMDAKNCAKPPRRETAISLNWQFDFLYLLEYIIATHISDLEEWTGLSGK